MTMKRMLSATFGLAALGVMLVGCSTTSSSSWLDSGNMYYRNSEYVSAADAFSEAIAKNPRSAAAWNNRGAARLRLGEISGAIADYNKAIELAPNDAEIYYNRANALVAAGQYPEAIADYTRAINLSPNYAKAIHNRGTAYAMLGQRDAAQADWSRAIALEPDPWAKMAMRRTAGLDPTPVVAVGPATGATQPAVASVPPPGMGPATVPAPRTPVPVTANPPVAPAPPPVVMVAPPTSQPQPAASVQALDARALASRAITRELDGDHTGAMQDLKTAMQLEPDASRRASIANLIRLLDTPR
jgi:tetratricopeptide (TPR) repeat protein